MNSPISFHLPDLCARFCIKDQRMVGHLAAVIVALSYRIDADFGVPASA